MSPQEYQLLSLPRLSHPARTLYWLHLRQIAKQRQPVTISYPELGRALAVEDPAAPGGFSFQVTARQLTQLFDELVAANLIAVQNKANQETYHLSTVVLPLLTQVTPLPQTAFPMRVNWTPDSSFANLCQLCGLIDSYYTAADLGEFIAYWIGRTDYFATQHQWMLKFIKTLKSRRYTQNKTIVTGYQQTSAASPEQTSSNQPSRRALEMMAQAQEFQDQEDSHHD